MNDVKVKSTDGFQQAIQAVLDDTRKVTYTALEKAVDATAKETVKGNRSRSPVLTGVYAKGWSSKKTLQGSGVYGKTVYNKEKPSLTHLLQNGHEVRGYLEGRGRSRTKAFDHIQSDDETERMYEANLTKAVEEELNGI